MSPKKKVTVKSIVKRWESKKRPLFTGSLIGEKNGEVCYCAQGNVLSQAGKTDAELRAMTQAKADLLVAEVLGISIAHAVLLRHVNDSADGCPQDVLSAPEKILGENAQKVLAFWRHLDGLTHEEWLAINRAARAARAASSLASDEIQRATPTTVFKWLPLFGFESLADISE